MQNNLVVAIYSHPSYYPPTLNALESLSGRYDNVSVVCRNYNGYEWIYPENVKLITYGKLINPIDVKRQGFLIKLKSFVSFTWLLLKVIRENNPSLILLYDSLPVLSYRILYKLVRKRTLWYHNHDVIDPELTIRYSLSWFALISERWIMNKLTLFSLPSLDRKKYFETQSLKGCFLFIPNYPSLKFFNKFRNVNKFLPEELMILFHGSLAPLHGFEEIITILNKKIQGKSFKLILKGFISEDYKTTLLNLAEKYAVSDKVIFLPHTGYLNVIENASKCHIGVGIYKKADIMNLTVATASNKIYEYAALGLPVLIFDNEYFRTALSRVNWVSFTDTTQHSLCLCLGEIIEKYDFMSQNATFQIFNETNFEKHFDEVFKII